MNPSIQILPLLHLESIHNTSQSTLPHAFKLKITSKFSLTNMLDDRLTFDETTRRCSTGTSFPNQDRSNISANQLCELRMMKVGSLSEMSEEECIRRYAEDPFFRKKLQAELRSLKKSCHVTAPPKNKDFMPFEVQSTTKLIDYEDKVTFRKMKLNETFEQLQEKGKF